MTNDPIADFLTRVRNAGAAKHASLNMPSSKAKLAICEILKSEGYIDSFEVVDLGNGKKDVNVALKYFNDKPVIEGLQRASKGSRRVYSKASDLPRVRGGLGIAIISTSKGMMTCKSARKAGLGGEIVASVW